MSGGFYHDRHIGAGRGPDSAVPGAPMSRARRIRIIPGLVGVTGRGRGVL